MITQKKFDKRFDELLVELRISEAQFLELQKLYRGKSSGDYPLVSIPTAAKIMKITPDAIYKAVREGRLTGFVKFGKKAVSIDEARGLWGNRLW